jgi:ABC-type sulfate transport system permease component
LRYFPPVIAIITAVLIIAALSYFGARFPSSLENELLDMEELAVIDTHLGTSFFTMAAVAVLYIGLAFYCVFSEWKWRKENVPRTGEGSGPTLQGSQAELRPPNP